MGTNLQQLRTYQLQECVGRGSIAEVWKAFDTQSQDYVALKIFRTDLQNDPFFMTRFWNLPFSQEAQKLLSLHHPDIVQIHSFQISRPSEAEHPLAYVVMDYVEGPTLADYIRDTSYKRAFPSATDIVYLFASVGTAIDYAHQEGVIHGDIKPTNILLDKRNVSRNPMGQPILSDIGITKLLGTSTGALSDLEADTAFYISPEQVNGHPANERSDLYALGVILYELCTGELPFRGDNKQAIMMQHINTAPPSPTMVNPAISPAVSAVIERSLEKDPTKRFSSAADMVTALAGALQVPLPENLSQPDYPAIDDETTLSSIPSTLPLDLASAEPSSHPNGTNHSSPESSTTESDGQADPTTPSVINESVADKTPDSSQESPETPPLPTTPTPASPPRPASPRRDGGPLGSKWRIALVAMLIILLAATTLGTLFVISNRHTNTNTLGGVPVAGHVYFISSGDLYINNNQGINDEVLVDLHNIAAPAPGKSYYAWLLGDEHLTDIPWIALGPVSVSQGNVHFLYPGDQAHTNLLNDMSRFLLTEGDSNTQPNNPLLDQSSWRYFGEIYQGPSPSDPNHFSLLDHLRHLLVQAPELQVLGLPGGLSIWTMRNVQEISKWALSAKERWETQNVAFIRQQLVNILYYLDGECTQQADLQGLPTGTPLLPENTTIAHIAHFALLNPCVQEEQEQAALLKQVFHHIPHNYVDHLLFHMAGVIQSPGATGSLHTLALQINQAINHMRTWLQQVRQDAEQLLHMNDAQLTQLSAFGVLGDLETQARHALAGYTDPDTGNTEEGAAWIFDNVARLAAFNVVPYSSH